ncbi:hypothetical protein A2U01_0052746, partial [Trifolium medium]|nr:hypothetical protein [Trifolium medium]
MKKSSRSLPEVPPMIFDNESKDVVLEFMRSMKEIGVVVTTADIAPAPTKDLRGKKVAASSSGKGKAVEVVKEKEKRKRAGTSESDKENVAKKPRTQKNTTKNVRKFVINEDDDEETEEEPLISKRKRSEPKVKEVNAEANA